MPGSRSQHFKDSLQLLSSFNALKLALLTRAESEGKYTYLNAEATLSLFVGSVIGSLLL